MNLSSKAVPTPQYPPLLLIDLDHNLVEEYSSHPASTGEYLKDLYLYNKLIGSDAYFMPMMREKIFFH